MDDDKLPTVSSRYGKEVQPWERKRQQGTVYEYKYTYSRVVMDFEPDDVLIDGALYELDGEKLFYRYPGKPPVMVTSDGVYKHMSFSTDSSEEQAYYVLSQLEYGGYVVGWKQTSQQ